MGTGTSWCWTCDLEHQAWAPACARCGGELHDEPPPVEQPASHDTVEIDLSGMEPGARDLFLLFLDGAGIHHDVRGLLLSIAADDEERTRELLETITSDTLVEFDPAEPTDDTEWSRSMAAMMHPSAVLPPERVGDDSSLQEVPTGLGPRVIAALVTGFAWSLAISLLLMLGMVSTPGTAPPRWLELAGEAAPFVGDVALVAIWGTTPGMFLLGMRVVDGQGGPPGWRTSIVRMLVFCWPNLLFWLEPAFGISPTITAAVSLVWYIAIAVSIVTGPQHQGWHDRLAGTWVVHGRFRQRDRSARPLPGPTGS